MHNYRPDIDGLRAIAVVSVIVFHFNSKWLPGGFVGVDIFFVISGYLITLHILGNAIRHQFSIRDFYIRRIKRLAPALFVVIAATLAAAQFIMLPAHFSEVARSAIAAVFSSANIFFVYGVDNGYFAPASSTRPLLHLWSLGVEEQFYILWPLAVVLLARRRLKTIWVVIAVFTLISVGLSQWLAFYYPTFAYYMLPGRAFELMFGALIAITVRSGFILSNILKWLSALTGLGLIAYSLICIDNTFLFPGLYAVPAALGAALLIYAGTHGATLPSRLIGNPCLAGVGLLSYSLYLWHWPLIAFLRYAYIQIDPSVAVLASAAMFILAFFSYRYVETPFRRTNDEPLAVFFKQFAVPGGVISIASALIILSGGFGLSQFDATYVARLNEAQQSGRAAYDFGYVCQRTTLSRSDATDPRCIINPNGAEPGILLWGDSHAAHYVGLFDVVANKYGFSFRNLAHSSCPPMMERAADYSTVRPKSACAQSVESVKEVLAKYHTLIISASWQWYYRTEGFAEEFTRTIESLSSQHKRIVLIGDPPTINDFDNQCSAKSLRLPINCARLFTRRRNVIQANAFLKGLAEGKPNVTYIDFNDYICSGQTCSPYKGGKSLYFNATHLNMDGSRAIGNAVVEAGYRSDLFKSLAQSHSGNSAMISATVGFERGPERTRASSP